MFVNKRKQKFWKAFHESALRSSEFVVVLNSKGSRECVDVETYCSV